MLALGYHNPFLNVGSSFMYVHISVFVYARKKIASLLKIMIKCRYPNLAAAQEAVTKCGETVIK